MCRFYRDAKILTIGEGTDEVQQMVIAARSARAGARLAACAAPSCSGSCSSPPTRRRRLPASRRQRPRGRRAAPPARGRVVVSDGDLDLPTSTARGLARVLPAPLAPRGGQALGRCRARTGSGSRCWSRRRTRSAARARWSFAGGARRARVRARRRARPAAGARAVGDRRGAPRGAVAARAARPPPRSRPDAVAATVLAGAALCALRGAGRPRSAAAYVRGARRAAVARARFAAPPSSSRSRRRRGWPPPAGLAGLVALEVVIFSLVFYVAVNDRLYGGRAGRRCCPDPGPPARSARRAPRADPAPRGLWLDRDAGCCAGRARRPLLRPGCSSARGATGSRSRCPSRSTSRSRRSSSSPSVRRDGRRRDVHRPHDRRPLVPRARPDCDPPHPAPRSRPGACVADFRAPVARWRR